ncbi:MAG: protein translocase subunit SecD, partial [Planctomycetota bacterium]
AVLDQEAADEDDDEDVIRPFRVSAGGAIVRNPKTGELVNLPTTVLGRNGELLQAEWCAQNEIPGLEILMVLDPDLEVTGEDLAFATSSYDDRGSPAVAFTLTDAGSGKFRVLTTENAPQGNRRRQLGIVMDDRLLSAPGIESPISKNGQISGNFTRQEVQSLVDILKAGQLPAALTKQPIAKNQIDATLGSDTIRKGVAAIGASLALVLVFILIYYRFAGMIAVLALILNLAMILGTMVLINQPLTLPGLAGLVLTVGMSVDANVLIFERIREEIKKGAKNRMAIRNGFAKATITIVDANLTTLFTAIVLYAIGTDQIRGFAVTLILGILYSMFTAIYMSRTLFDVAERHNKVSLGMSDAVNSLRHSISGGGMLDFISKGKLTLAFSAVLIVIGIGSLVARGKTILDIDFAGGSSVQFRVSQSSSSQAIRDMVASGIGEFDGSPVRTTINGVSMDGAADGTVFKVDSSLEKVSDLQERLVKIFSDAPDVDLVTYDVAITSDLGTSSSATPTVGGVRLVSFQDEDAKASSDDETADGVDPPVTEDVTENSEGPDNSESSDDGEGAEDGDTNAGPVLSDFDPAVRTVTLGIEGSESEATISGPTLVSRVKEASEEIGISLNERSIEIFPEGEGSQDWKPESNVPFAKWVLKLPLDEAAADQLMVVVQSSLDEEPVWISSNSVGARVAGQMIGRASVALFASLLVIILYIWFRFQRVIYGFAAVAALVHDVLITLGAIAISYYLADALGFLG